MSRRLYSGIPWTFIGKLLVYSYEYRDNKSLVIYYNTVLVQYILWTTSKIDYLVVLRSERIRGCIYSLRVDYSQSNISKSSSLDVQTRLVYSLQYIYVRYMSRLDQSSIQHTIALQHQSTIYTSSTSLRVALVYEVVYLLVHQHYSQYLLYILCIS